ncbi:MAG: GNAT family N-acetyltransferase [Alphaproteobacteria bacterium]|nr:GNAT family N-acetyltransferase [Alphaproteobacteria bacterium]
MRNPLEITYREMTEADIEAAFVARTSTIENPITRERLETQYNITPETWAANLKGPQKGWVAICREDVVGFSVADKEEGEVKALAVIPAFEGHNAGRTLLKLACLWLFDQGFETLKLLSNPDPRIRAFSFYRRLGWKPIGEMYGEDEVLTLTHDEFRHHVDYL